MAFRVRANVAREPHIPYPPPCRPAPTPTERPTLLPLSEGAALYGPLPREHDRRLRLRAGFGVARGALRGSATHRRTRPLHGYQHHSAHSAVRYHPPRHHASATSLLRSHSTASSVSSQYSTASMPGRLPDIDVSVPPTPPPTVIHDALAT
ncbi:hypothetical protein B0H11DRAFT_1993483, partial [Mycena galericulata]